MNIITPDSLNLLINSTPPKEEGAISPKSLWVFGACIALGIAAGLGFLSFAFSAVLVALISLWALRQTHVCPDACAQIQRAFVERGLHCPTAPATRSVAETMVDALREYDAAKKV